MFCPNCGKDNSKDQKYCASCGTNLEAVAQALTGREEDFFTKMDMGIDYFVALYTERLFKNSAQGIADRKVAKSWQLLGQAVVTTLVDILLFTLMWNILPLRFLILCISTPFRLLAERGSTPTERTLPRQDYRPPQINEAPAGLWLDEAHPSVTENTTTHLQEAATSDTTRAATTDRLGR